MRGIVLASRPCSGKSGNRGAREILQPSIFCKRRPQLKPAPDLFLHAAARMGVQAADCIVVEDSAAGVAAAMAAGMTAFGFVGGSHAGAHLGEQLGVAGARTIVADLRHFKNAAVALRGW